MTEDPRPARTPSTHAAMARLQPLLGTWETGMSVDGTRLYRRTT